MSGGYGHGGPFDSRAAEAAFSSAGNVPPSTGAQNGSTGYSGTTYGGGMDGANDPFAFLNSGMGGLSMNDDSRRNGANSNKSPA